MAPSWTHFLTCWAFYALSSVSAQTVAPAVVQNNTFNSTTTISHKQAKAASLDRTTKEYSEVALQFEQSNWAGQSVSQPFYQVPAGTAHLPFGSLIKKEEPTNTTLYTLPPNVALSRFIFQSETANGTAVPASGYVLWPFEARQFDGVDGVPLVAFAHGNSGYEGECAPSHLRNLWYQFHAPFELALAGYAVVAPDYAGLGVDKDARGKKITAQWLTNPAAANDIVHAVTAAKKGFPQLSSQFVVMGHSQGGGAAWATAIRQQTVQKAKGYQGTVAASPFTDFAGSVRVNPAAAAGLAPGLANTLPTIFPTFRRDDFLTPLGISRLELLNELQGCNSVSRELLAADTTKPNITSNKYFQWFDAFSSVGGKDIAGPLLILQGTADTTVNVNITSNSVKETCKNHPERKLQYIEYVGADHVPTLYASRLAWMSFIEDRFNGVVWPAGCSTKTVTPLKPVANYQKEVGYFIEFSKYLYENS